MRALRAKLLAEMTEKHVRLGTLVVCECGYTIERSQLRHHQAGFWHREYRNVLNRLREGETQESIAKSFGHDRQWLHSFISRSKGH